MLNALRHANAKFIELKISHGKSALELAIRDDRVGLDDAILKAGERSGFLGVKGMPYRATSVHGTRHAQRLNERGPQIQVTIPAKYAYNANAPSSPLLSLFRAFRKVK